MFKGSWRTTLFGAGGLGTLLVSAAQALLDADPVTNPQWELLIAGAMPCIAALFARDNKVRSEAVGAK